MSTPQFKIVVHQGPIHINSVVVVKANAEVIYLEADSRAKYPELVCMSERQWDLVANEETLYTETSERLTTTIELEGLEGDWDVFCETGRYSIRIVLVSRGEWVESPMDWYDTEGP